MFGKTCWQTELADSKPVPCVQKQRLAHQSGVQRHRRLQ